MIKKTPYGNTLKDQLKAGARDRLFNFLLADGAIRGVIVHGTRMVNEMRTNHELGILETLVLGRAYLGVGMMSADLKSVDRISLKIDCSGPIKGLVVEANAFGEVKGYLVQVPIPIDKPMEDYDLSPFFGAGFLEVTKHIEDAKQPFTGKIALEYGNVALDLANYYLQSEQIPTAFNLSIKFDRQGVVSGAGGLFMQAMPNAGHDLVADLEQRVSHLPSLGERFAESHDAESLVQEAFGKHSPQFLANRRIEFMCHCSKKRLQQYLTMLPSEDIEEIRQNGPFPLELRCHHCNTVYEFSKEEIQEI